MSFSDWWKRNIADPFMREVHNVFGYGQGGWEVGWNSNGGFFTNPTYNGAPLGPSAYYSNGQVSFGNGSGGFHDNSSSVRIDNKIASSMVQAVQDAKQKWYDNLGVYSTGVILTIEDVYNNFGYNHTSYPTTRGYMKDFSDYKKVADMSDQALKYKKLSGRIQGLGNLGTGLMTLQSINRFVDGDRTILNATDGVVGITGLTNSALLEWTTYGTPIIGQGVAIYSFGRLYFDCVGSPNVNQIKNNINNNKHPLDGVYNPFLGEYYTPSIWDRY
jgi:hypothetical protein